MSNVVLAAISDTPKEEGMSVEEIVACLAITHEEALACVHYLSLEALIYSTISDNVFFAC
jgi:hypothetical protein